MGLGDVCLVPRTAVFLVRILGGFVIRGIPLRLLVILLPLAVFAFVFVLSLVLVVFVWFFFEFCGAQRSQSKAVKRAVN